MFALDRDDPLERARAFDDRHRLPTPPEGSADFIEGGFERRRGRRVEEAGCERDREDSVILVFDEPAYARRCHEERLGARVARRPALRVGALRPLWLRALRRSGHGLDAARCKQDRDPP